MKKNHPTAHILTLRQGLLVRIFENWGTFLIVLRIFCFIKIPEMPVRWIRKLMLWPLNLMTLSSVPGIHVMGSQNWLLSVLNTQGHFSSYLFSPYIVSFFLSSPLSSYSFPCIFLSYRSLAQFAGPLCLSFLKDKIADDIFTSLSLQSTFCPKSLISPTIYAYCTPSVLPFSTLSYCY